MRNTKAKDTVRKVLEIGVLIIIIGLIIIMFTGRAGAMISITVFGLLIIAANIPSGSRKEKEKNLEGHESKAQKTCTDDEANRVA